MDWRLYLFMYEYRFEFRYTIWFCSEMEILLFIYECSNVSSRSWISFWDAPLNTLELLTVCCETLNLYWLWPQHRCWSQGHLSSKTFRQSCKFLPANSFWHHSHQSVFSSHSFCLGSCVRYVLQTTLFMELIFFYKLAF